MKNGVWTPFGVTFASSMQTALRQTSNCLFSMRSYRVSLEYDTRTHFILRLCFSLSPSIRSLALARNRLFFLLALAPPCVILSLHWLHIRSLVHELHASIFLSLFDKQASSPFFFFSFTLGPLDHLFIHERRKCAWTTFRSLNIAAVVRLRFDHIFFVRCWLNNLYLT